MMENSSNAVVIQVLFKYFQKLIPLNVLEKQLVKQYFKSRRYKKRQYVLQEGDICNQFNFVVSGCLRLFKNDSHGNSHVVQFATENWWILDLGSFHGRKPAELNIDAMEDTLVLQISYENLIELYLKIPKFDRIFRVQIENSYVVMQRRLLENISSTAENRYLSFVETYPHLIGRLPQTQIASFLGVTPEFLSRLRKKIR